VGAGLLAYAGWSLRDRVAESLGNLPLPAVAWAAAIYAGGQVLSAWRWGLLVAPLGTRPPLRRLVEVYFVGMFANLFLPGTVGGDGIRALGVAREAGGGARGFASVFLDRDVGLGGLIAFAMAANTVEHFTVTLGGEKVRLLWVCLVLLAGWVGANLFLLSRRARRRVAGEEGGSGLGARLRAQVARFMGAVAVYREHPHTVAAAFLVSLAYQASEVACVVLLAWSMGSPALALVSPLAFAVFIPLIAVATMAPVTVAGIGVRELAYVGLFAQVGVEKQEAVALSVAYFVVVVLASLPGGIVWLVRGSRGVTA